MNKEELKQGLDKVAADLALLTDEEFRTEMEKHKDGDIARIVRDSGMLDIFTEETMRITILTSGIFRNKVFDIAHEYRVSASDFIRIAIAECVEKYGFPADGESRHNFLKSMIRHEKEWLSRYGLKP